MTIYDTIGQGYIIHRIPDLRIEKQIHAALGDARTVLNVGAGTGSYEPKDRLVTAVEPSITMINQRPKDASPVVQASAEALPFSDKQFDAAMAILTIHHWNNWPQGLNELRRVAGKIVILTIDPAFEGFWLTQDYFPEVLRIDQSIFPAIQSLKSELGKIEVEAVPIPHDCTDGFGSAYWARPEAYLDENIRNSMSTFKKLKEQDVAKGVNKLRKDLESGRWHEMNGHLLQHKEIDLGYRLIISN